MKNLPEIFGTMAFNEKAMTEYLSAEGLLKLCDYFGRKTVGVGGERTVGDHSRYLPGRC